MTALKVNREFFLRHLAVALVMLGVGGWFAYDGFVVYPRTPAAELYEKIEKSAPGEGFPLEGFKRQKIRSQYGFTVLCLLAAALIGLHLAAVCRFRFAYDETGFEWRGRRRPLSDVKSVDRAAWKRKGIVKIALSDGSRVTLDAWHHVGVKEFERLLPPV